MKIPSDHTEKKSIVLSVVQKTSPEQQETFLVWAQELIAIRNSNDSKATKVHKTLNATRSAKVIWPLLKMISKEITRVVWNERGTKSRWFLGGALVGGALFGGQGAGIAALGTAIGVPLWVVFGGGGLVLGSIVEELQKKKRIDEPKKVEGKEKMTIDVESKLKD